MLAICTLSHGNADPERGFSINGYMLKIHGSSTSHKTIKALRLVKDFIILNGGVNDMEITMPMIKKCAQARQRWEEDLKAQRKAKLDEEKAREQVS